MRYIGVVSYDGIDWLRDESFALFLGNSPTLYLRVLRPNYGDPLDLTSCTEIDVALRKNDGTSIHLTLSANQVTIIAPAVLGKFSVPLTSVLSTTLNGGVQQDIDATFTVSSQVFTVKFERALSVFQVP